jgi:valyl-tRNA synthetase
MENIKDWCISRQLWWGHRIPAWYLPDGKVVVGMNEQEALEEARKLSGNEGLTIADLQQDEDVLDTWFSSWLWPISVFDGIRNPENPDINYYYPTNDLITAPDILFFWVARMVIAGYEYRQAKPFENVYLTGMVRDAQKRKMSKSLGNSPDPLDLIAKFGADGVRVGMLLCSSAGNDLLFDESLTEQGRNFGNKIWNAFRLLSGWEVSAAIPQPETSRLAGEWFTDRFNQELGQLNDHFSKYRLSEALMAAYKLFWDDFSSWYLEIIKPGYQQPIDAKTHQQALGIMEKLMLVLHPFMPFITEEIWQRVATRRPGESVMVAAQPDEGPYNEELLERFERMKEAVVFVRSVRAERNIPFRTELSLQVKQGETAYDDYLDPVLIKLLNLSEVRVVEQKTQGSTGQVIRSVEYYVPLDGTMDMAAEKEKLQKELEYASGFLGTVMQKLSNERFVSNAPAKVLETERAKQADAEARIKSLTEQIAALGS